MKKVKKLLSLIVAAVMVIAMAVPTFADDQTAVAGKCKITAPTTSHQYEIYQIFTGNLSGTVLSNVKWGANGTGTKDDAVSETILNELTGISSTANNDVLSVVKKYVNLETTPVATITNGGIYEAEAGYYLIKDKNGSVTGTDSYTTYIVKVVGDVTIEPKSDVPSFEKKLKDKNDTDGTVTDWQDSADYDIGDAVPFKLEGTVAANYAEYKGAYYFAFHDVEEPGLTFNADSVKAYVKNGDTDIEINKTEYTVKTTGITDGCSFEVIFNNLKDITAVKAGSKIRVEYTSTLNDQAVIGNHGNLNKGKLEFSNNPNYDQEGKPNTGETPWDNVIVFTYKVVVNKVKSDNTTPLAGAEFTLVKKLKDGSEKNIAVVKNAEGTSFEFRGLDDGEYILTETKTPDKYNSIAPITFTVNADHTITWDGTNRDTVLTSLTGNQANGEITFTQKEDDTEQGLTTNVVNKAGTELPSTGGMGTKILYTLGVILVLGAGIVLVTRKRVSDAAK